MIAANLPPWAARMETASFRDMSFLTESHEYRGGRRLAVHEFPGAEKPEVEDMGKKAEEFRLNAYFIGADYDLFRNKFLSVLKAPGADWLTHPWLGLLWVRPHNWSVSESNEKGGYCAVSVDFVPGGTQAAMIQADLTDLAAGKINGFGVDKRFALVQMSDTSMTALVKSVNAQLTRMRNLISMAGLPLAWANRARNMIDGIMGDAATLLALPAQYAAAFGSFADMMGAGADVCGVADTARPALVSNIVAMSGTPIVNVGGAGDSPALRINQQRVANFNGQLLIASAAQVALADYRSATDRDAALASVLGTIDSMLPRMSDPVFQAALDMRAALIDALQGQQLEPAQVRDIVHPIPAAVLAHRMEVDEDVFMVVNQVRHPLFVKGRIYG